jgi:hypothetical protein
LEEKFAKNTTDRVNAFLSEIESAIKAKESDNEFQLSAKVR